MGEIVSQLGVSLGALMRISSLYKGILAILNALLLLEVVPQAIATIVTLANHREPSGSANDTWRLWLFLINSLVVLGSSFTAFLAIIFCMGVKFGRGWLWADIFIKFACMCAYGVSVGFEINDQINTHHGGVNGETTAFIVSAVWAAGVPEVFLALSTIIFEF